MSVSETFVLPGARAVLHRALPNLVEGKLIPTLLFIGFYGLAGTAAALVAALGWSLAAIGYRRARGRRIPGLLLLGLVGLAGKTVVALATGSMLLYFLQPTLTTALVGCTFLASTFAGRPLAERLVHDLWPLDPQWAAHPELRRFFVRLSVLWALTSLANAAITLWLLLTQPVTTFVMVKSVLGPMSAVCAVLPAVLWLRSGLRRHGVRVEFAARGASARSLDTAVPAAAAA
jgi:hypothetical protein